MEQIPFIDIRADVRALRAELNAQAASERATPESKAHEARCSVAAGSALRYRLIEPGEIIQAGDEAIEADCQTWTRLPIGGGNAVWQCWMIGVQHNPHMMVPHRRPVQNTKAQT